MSIFRSHLDQLINYAIKTGTSRSIAAVFRVMRNMLETDYPTSSTQIALDCTVDLATRYPPCLPHVVDFLKFISGTKLERLSHEICLSLIDAYDDMNAVDVETHVEYLIPFFMEASTHHYEFCQPRVRLIWINWRILHLYILINIQYVTGYFASYKKISGEER